MKEKEKDEDKHWRMWRTNKRKRNKESGILKIRNG